MFKIFTIFADWIVYILLKLDSSTKFADALHFFIEDISKIFVLLLVMIYMIAIL